MLRTRADQELEGMFQQPARAASTPPGAMLSDQQTPSHPPQRQHQGEVLCRQPAHHLPASALQQHGLHTAGSELMHPMHGPADLQLQQRQPKHHQTLQLHWSSKEPVHQVQTSLLGNNDAWPPAQQHEHAQVAGYHARSCHQHAPDASDSLEFQQQSAACIKPDAQPQMQAAEQAQSQGESVRLGSKDSAMLIAPAQLMPVRHVLQQHSRVLLHMANRGAGEAAQGELDHDDALKVQKLAVTPHKLSSRQLSGNPFAEASFTDSHQSDAGVGEQPVHSTEPEQQPSQPNQALLQAAHSPRQTHQAPMPLAVSHSTRHVARPTDVQPTAQLDQQLSHKQQSSQRVGSVAELSQQTCQPARPVGHSFEKAASAQSSVPVRQGNEADVGPSLSAVSRDSGPDLNHSQLSRSLLESLEQEAVAADEEACLQELQVCVSSSIAPFAILLGALMYLHVSCSHLRRAVAFLQVKCELRLCMIVRPCDVIMQCLVSWSHLCYSQCYGLHFDQLLPAVSLTTQCIDTLFSTSKPIIIQLFQVSSTPGKPSPRSARRRKTKDYNFLCQFSDLLVSNMYDLRSLRPPLLLLRSSYYLWGSIQ